MHKSVSASDVYPNPFRKMERYPISETKIEMLIGSMGRTGFWDNVVGREQNGHVELAYGHHRWVAFKKKFGLRAEMNIIIRDLNDEDMLRVMADENVSEYGTSAEVEQETIRAVVEAYAEGKIELKKPKGVGLSSVRNAPSFRIANQEGFKALKSLPKPYNAKSIARFLGWMSGKQVAPRIRNALDALERIEEGLLDADVFKGTSSSQGKELSDGADRIYKSYDDAAKTTANPKEKKSIRARGKRVARRAAKKAAKSLRVDPKSGKKEGGIRRIQADMEKSCRQGPKVIPTVERFVSKLTGSMDKVFSAKNPRWMGLGQVAKHSKDLEAGTKKNLTVVLNRIIDRCRAMIDAIEGNPPKLKK